MFKFLFNKLLKIDVNINTLRQNTVIARRNAIQKDENQEYIEAYIKGIAKKCIAESKAGNSSTVIMTVRGPSPPCDHSFLKGTEKIIWDACQRSNLKPSLKYYGEYQGEIDSQSYYHIVVNWD